MRWAPRLQHGRSVFLVNHTTRGKYDFYIHLYIYNIYIDLYKKPVRSTESLVPCLTRESEYSAWPWRFGVIYAARLGQSYGSCLGSRKGHRSVWGHGGRTDSSGMRPVPYCWITWYWCALGILQKFLLFAGGLRLREVQMPRILSRS